MKRLILLITLTVVASISFYAQNIHNDTLDISTADEDYLNSFFEIDDSLLAEHQRTFVSRVRSRYVSNNASIFSHNKRIHYTPNNENIGNYLIITSDTLFSLLRKDITMYAEDVHAVYGVGVIVESESNASPNQLKDIIQSYESNLDGVLFIGDLGEVLYEQTYNNTYAKWPCDLFFMDLDGIWEDINGNGIFDKHTGDVKPEIFMARISSSEMSVLGDEIDLIRSQLMKSHSFWRDSSIYQLHQSLNYIDKDWANNSYFVRSNFDMLYGTERNEDIRNLESTEESFFSKDDYLSRISSNTYSAIFLASHSSPVAHVINKEYAYTNDIYTNNNSCFFYNLFCCSACNWTLANSRGYLGGAYLFSGNTLAVIGSTKTGSMLGFDHFYRSLSLGNPIGRSMLDWWISYPGRIHSEKEIHWFYGLSILGDPMINLQYYAMNNNCNNIYLEYFPSDNCSNLVIYKAAKSIVVSENFIIPQGVKVIFDAPNVIFNPGFNCSIGATFETRTEGCSL